MKKILFILLLLPVFGFSQYTDIYNGIQLYERGGSNFSLIFTDEERHALIIGDNANSSKGQSTFIAAGENDSIESTVVRSAIIGGESNRINSGVQNSVILGGDGITATTSNFTYVPNLSIGNFSLQDNSTYLAFLEGASFAFLVDVVGNQTTHLVPITTNTKDLGSGLRLFRSLNISGDGLTNSGIYFGDGDSYIKETSDNVIEIRPGNSLGLAVYSTYLKSTSIRPFSDNIYNLGNISENFKHLYLSGSIYKGTTEIIDFSGSTSIFRTDVNITGTNKLLMGDDGGEFIKRQGDNDIAFYTNNSRKMYLGNTSLFMAVDINFTSDNTLDIGSSAANSRNHYIKGSIYSGTTELIDFSNTSEIDIKTNVECDTLRPEFIEFIPPHTFLKFSDSTVSMSLTQNVFSQVTNSNDSIYRVIESTGFNIDADTVQCSVKGHYNIDYQLSFSGSTNDNYIIKLMGDINGNIMKLGQGEVSTSFSNQNCSLTLPCYVLLDNPGTFKVWAEIQTTTSSHSITLKDSNWRTNFYHNK
jgi:hypothetical protein